MRIEKLFIDGFGHFAQSEFGPFNAPITIFYGENEAGKSTILAFIRTILFGFPTRGRDEFYPALRGGRHGGHIVIVDDDGTRYSIERFAAARGGNLSVKDEEGNSYGETKLRELVGHSSKELFENVFAFGLDELQEMKSLDNEEVQGRIYSAGLGVTDLPKVVREIERLQGGIYRPGGNLGSTQSVAQVLSELEEVEAELSIHYQDAPRYAELIDRIEQTKDEIGTLQENRTDINGNLDHQRKLLTVRDDLMEIGILEDKLLKLPQTFQFPQEGVSRLESLLEQVAKLEEVELQAAASVEKLQEVVASPLAEGDLLEDSANIRKAMSERARLSAAVQDLPERQSEANQQEVEVNRFLKDLGPGWDPARLEAFDVSLPSRDKVNQEKKKASEIRQSLTNRQTEKESAEREMQTASEVVKRAALELEQAGPSDYDEAELAKRRGAITVARNGLARISESNQRRSGLGAAGTNGSGVNSGMLLLVSSLILFIVGIGLLAWGIGGDGGNPAVTIAILSLAVGLGLAVLRFLSKLPLVSSVPVDGLESEMAELESDLSDARKILGLPSLDFTKLGVLGEELEASSQKLVKIQNLERTHRDALLDLDRRSQDLERATAVVADLDAEVAQAEQAWKAWLKGRDLVETMSLDGVLDLFTRVETARVSLSNKLERQGRVSAIEQDIVEISELVAPLAMNHGISIDIELPTTLIPAIDELSNRLESARLALSTLEANRASLTESEERLEQERRRLEVVRSDLKELMLLVGTEDAEEFRRLGSIDHEIQSCRNDLDGHATAIRLLFGPAADQEALREDIGGRSSLALEESIDETQRSLAEVEENRDGLRKELTLAERELAELGASDEASELMARRETLVEELSELGSQWSKYSLALEMLQKARDRHEKDRQPQVIQSASEFFRSVTGGRYQGLRAPAGESVINAVTDAGVERKSSQLSRGTKEQMYLAIRFGLVREFSQHMTSLPVIVDDALVNSDPRRARAASEGFANVAETNQVLVFTCHPALVELFQKATKDAEVYNLESLTQH
ncbi:MAG: AAA family ATPase [Verrucomicrobia bacterium]|nr:AAA family ATPase [Verrucomicrobiota bacterium]